MTFLRNLTVKTHQDQMMKHKAILGYDDVREAIAQYVKNSVECDIQIVSVRTLVKPKDYDVRNEPTTYEVHAEVEYKAKDIQEVSSASLEIIRT